MEATLPAQEENGNASPVRKRRIGRFIVGHDTFRVDWRALRGLFAKVVPLRAESLFHLDGIEYLALCEEFEEIEIREAVPFYDVAYREVEGREMFVFVRREEEEKHPTPGSAGALRPGESNIQHPTSNGSI